MFRYPDPTPQLPFLHGFSVKKKPIWKGFTPIAVSGKETQVLRQAFPIWEFTLTYELLRSQTENIEKYTQWSPSIEYERIAAVFLACKGQYGRFYFQDPSDCSREGQIIGVADGSTRDFRLVRTFGFGDLAFTEPVGGVDQNYSSTVYLDGLPATAWSFLEDLQTVHFDSPPLAGLNVTIDFYYLFYCRFLEDVEDFEEFMRNIHSMTALIFHSTKDCDPTTPNPFFLNGPL